MVGQLKVWRRIKGRKVAVAVSAQWDANLFNQTRRDNN